MICNKVGVARVSDIEEVPTTCEIHDGGFLKLLASSFHCINNSNNVPENVAFTVYRILVIITISFIMKMVVP